MALPRSTSPLRNEVVQTRRLCEAAPRSGRPLQRGERMNKKQFFASSVAVLALLSFVGMTSVAGADPTSSHSGGANAVVTGPIRIDQSDPTVAYLTGRYTCPASPEPAHLFVSAKQVAGGKPDSRLKEEGSSQYTYPDGGWLLRHPGATEFTCDGTWHTGTWEFSS